VPRSARAVLLAEFSGFEKRVRAMARLHEKARLLMSTPAVGTIVSLTFACAIDDPARLTSSRPYLGLTPKKYQSGQTDDTGRISGHGDASAREALLRGGPPHADQADQGMLRTQKLGDADRPTRGRQQGQGSAGTQARRDHASDAQGSIRLPGQQRLNNTQNKPVFGRAITPGSSRKRSPFAGTMDQARPSHELSTHPTM
jgi:hypothetical protein